MDTILMNIAIWIVLGIITHVAHSVHYHKWLQTISEEDQKLMDDFFDKPYEDNGREPSWQENLLRAALLWPVLWFEYIINFGTGKNGFDVILDEIKGNHF